MRTHGICGQRHQTWAEVARCSATINYVSGDGPWAPFIDCSSWTRSCTLHASQEEAVADQQRLDKAGCGAPKCRLWHIVIDLERQLA